jgi:hypothetical protein
VAPQVAAMLPSVTRRFRPQQRRTRTAANGAPRPSLTVRLAQVPIIAEPKSYGTLGRASCARSGRCRISRSSVRPAQRRLNHDRPGPHAWQIGCPHERAATSLIDGPRSSLPALRPTPEAHQLHPGTPDARRTGIAWRTSMISSRRAMKRNATLTRGLSQSAGGLLAGRIAATIPVHGTGSWLGGCSFAG